jgi:acyl-lipid omega-6 desaturase (Delta-12 desaturase)
MGQDGYSNSRQIDAWLRSSDLTLGKLRASIPKELRRPVEWRSWLTLVRVLACMALCLFALSQITLAWGPQLLWQIPVLCAVWFVYGAVLLGFFLVGHDCGHRSFSRHKAVNTVVGTLCMAPIFNGFRTWQLTHGHHHQHTQVWGADVDWSSHLVTAERRPQLSWRRDFAIKLGYSIPFGVFWWIMWNALQRGARVKPMLKAAHYERNKRGLRWGNALMWLVTLGIYGSLLYFVGFWGLLKYHHIPVSIGSLLGGVMVSVGHANRNTLWYDQEAWSPVRGQLVSTYDYRFPRWLEWLVLNINVHIPHHVSVSIPWYHLKAAARSLKAAYPDYYQQLPFRFRDMSWIVWAPVVEHDEVAGTYQMKAYRPYDEAPEPSMQAQ